MANAALDEEQEFYINLPDAEGWKFPDHAKEGTRVIPSIGSIIENKGPGVLLYVQPDRRSAAVRFEKSGEIMSIEPWDCHCDEPEQA